MEPLKLIIFDIYSTLLYSPDIFSPYYEIIQTCHSAEKAWHYILRSNHQSADHLFKALLKTGLLIHEDVEEIKDKFKHNLVEKLKSIEPYRDSLSILETLSEQGYVLGIISNVPTPYVTAFLKSDLSPYFGYSIFSCCKHITKPQEEIYEVMRKDSKYSFEEMLMIEGEKNQNLKTARNLGMRTLYLKRNKDKSRINIMPYFNKIEAFLSS